MRYFERYLAGESMQDISRDVKRSVPLISRYITVAAKSEIENGQKEAHSRLVSAAIDVMVAKLLKDKDSIKRGEPADVSVAERILEGLFIFDHLPEDPPPNPDADPVPGVETLASFQVIQRPVSQLPPIQHVEPAQAFLPASSRPSPVQVIDEGGPPGETHRVDND